jgi:acetate kinase
MIEHLTSFADNVVAFRCFSAAAVSDLLYQSSGLLGVSGISDDMKTRQT